MNSKAGREEARSLPNGDDGQVQEGMQANAPWTQDRDKRYARGRCGSHIDRRASGGKGGEELLELQKRGRRRG